MKIKVWLFVLVLCGALVIGLAGGFVAGQGFSLAKLIVDHVKVNVSSGDQAQLPGMPWGGNQGGQYGDGTLPWGGGQGTLPWEGGRRNQPSQPGQDDSLPSGFNAGVSIPGTYGEMTGRTEEQVLAEADKAGTDTWGLAKKEGKLDDLKKKVLEAVTASLDKMVSDGKITTGQKDAYLKKVNAILEVAGQQDQSTLPWSGGQQPGA